MNDPIATLEWLVQAQQDIPSLEEMPRRTLAEKGIAGPTAAHVIEEIHTPLNLALVTFTTGSSAFQNIVGVTHSELPLRIAAGKRALAGSGYWSPTRRWLTCLLARRWMRALFAGRSCPAPAGMRC